MHAFMQEYGSLLIGFCFGMAGFGASLWHIRLDKRRAAMKADATRQSH